MCCAATSRREAPAQAPLADEPLRATTLAVVATNVALTKTHLTKLAMMANTGAARAINPYHTQGDGDQVLAVSTGLSNANVSLTALGAIAAEVVADAILRAAKMATSVAGVDSSQGSVDATRYAAVSVAPSRPAGERDRRSSACSGWRSAPARRDCCPGFSTRWPTGRWPSSRRSRCSTPGASSSSARLILAYGADRLGLPRTTWQFFPVPDSTWMLGSLLALPVIGRTFWYAMAVAPPGVHRFRGMLLAALVGAAVACCSARSPRCGSASASTARLARIRTQTRGTRVGPV